MVKKRLCFLLCEAGTDFGSAIDSPCDGFSPSLVATEFFNRATVGAKVDDFAKSTKTPRCFLVCVCCDEFRGKQCHVRSFLFVGIMGMTIVSLSKKRCV